jgi:hypothetical protein
MEHNTQSAPHSFDGPTSRAADAPVLIGKEQIEQRMGGGALAYLVPVLTGIPRV